MDTRDNGVTYLEASDLCSPDDLALCVTTDKESPRNPYVMGYGPKVPTSWRIKLADKRWRRVYVMQWSNSGSSYVLVGGKTVHLGVVEDMIKDL